MSEASLDAKLGVLVLSCDAYSDVWPPFFALFFRYWADCPYPVVLLANDQVFDHERVQTVTVGPDRDWSSNLLDALELIECNYLLVMMEDYLLMEAVQTDRIEELFQLFVGSNAACLRLYPAPGPDRLLPNHTDIGEINPGSPYRVSLQAGLWRKDAIRQLLRAGETGWEFEMEGSRRSGALNRPFLSVTWEKRPLTYLSTGVVKGRWIRPAIDLCRSEGIVLDFSRRGVESLARRMLRMARTRVEIALWHILFKWRKHS